VISKSSLLHYLESSLSGTGTVKCLGRCGVLSNAAAEEYLFNASSYYIPDNSLFYAISFLSLSLFSSLAYGYYLHCTIEFRLK
jgi:hypothetical protein